MSDGDNHAGVMHEFVETKTGSSFAMKFSLILCAVVVLGIATGYILSRSINTSSSLSLPGTTKNGSLAKGTAIGSNDTTTFKDTTEGKLVEGGIEGEGQFHLVRPGGDSQNVYVTSSIVDLSKVVGKKIKVWGQTQKAQKAGWLMDVGRIEVLE